MKTRIAWFALVIATLSSGLVLAPGGAWAQSADRMSRSIYTAREALDDAAANYAAVPAARAALNESDRCFTVSKPGQNIGDESLTDLLRVRECVATLLDNLLDRMVALKSLQSAAGFDYALFTETVRLLASTDTPAKQALTPFAAMLRSAQAAAGTEAQATLLSELAPLGDKLAANAPG